MKRIFILAAALFTAASLSAQDFDSSIKRWDDGPLTWDDFTLYSGGFPVISSLNYSWHAQQVTTKTGNLTVTRMQTECYMNPVASWVNPNHRDPYTLLYQQVAFNYVELCRRQLQKELDVTKGNSMSELNQFYASKAERFIAKLQEETDQGQDTSMVRFYDVQVKEQLEDLPKESQTPDFKKDIWGLGMNIGYGNEFRLGRAANYVRPIHGLEGGFDFSYKNVSLYWNVFMGIGGKNPQEIVHKGYIWRVGEAQSESATEIGVSVPVIDGPWIKLAPFAGAGYGFVESTIGTDANGRKVTDCISGPRFVAGLTLDIKYKRWLDLCGHDILYYAIPVGTARGYSESCVRLLAYAARTNLEYPIGPSWSANFGLSLYIHNWDVR